MIEYSINGTVWQYSRATCNNDIIYYIKCDYHHHSTCNTLLEVYETILKGSKIKAWHAAKSLLYLIIEANNKGK